MEQSFTPVPTRARHDGWTADRQRDFIRALPLMPEEAAEAAALGPADGSLADAAARRSPAPWNSSTVSPSG